MLPIRNRILFAAAGSERAPVLTEEKRAQIEESRVRRLCLRGCGEGRASPLLRASSSSWSRWRLERRGRREDRIFFLCVRTKSAQLPNEAVFSIDRVRLVIFQTIARQRREAGTRPRSPRFKWRAGTPHPPLHQPSGAESTTTNGSTSALVCELHERATRPTRWREVVLRLLLHIWIGCGGLLNGVAVADIKRCRRGDAPYRALSR